MNGKTHVLVGLGGGFIASALLYRAGIFDIPDVAATIVGSAVGSYVPDIDHTGSVAGKKMPLVSWPIKGLYNLFDALYNSTNLKIFKKLSNMFTHRGLFHAPLFWLLLFVPTFLFLTPLIDDTFVHGLVNAGLFGLLVGILLHLLADMLNPTGIPLLMPIIDKKFRLARIVTGSGGEMIFRICMVVVLVVIGIISFSLMQGGSDGISLHSIFS